jgi:hypothetical protein
MQFFKKIPFPTETSYESFLPQFQKIMFRNRFYQHNIKSPAKVPPNPLSLVFTAVSDHPKAGEAPMPCGLQSNAAPIRIPISFCFQAIQSVGVAVLIWVHSSSF